MSEPLTREQVEIAIYHLPDGDMPDVRYVHTQLLATDAALRARLAEADRREAEATQHKLTKD